ncbi:endoglucanase E-4 [Hyalella azteca]|uniref:Endoglucanase n=1 Tax=Hyalella azteca TaxID=294128 RepID=A0A8B7PM66_HYAAZ|nr:endoglucanase E-4 [Hyalella azteca]
MWALVLLGSILTMAHGLPRSTRMCESATIVEAWPGGYKGTVSFAAPSAYSSVILDLYFLHPVNSLQITTGGQVTSESDTHFVYTVGDSGSAGSTVSYDFQVAYSEQQPLLGAMVFNGDDVCGAGGGLTTAPPLPNPCAATGTTPYDYPQVLCMSILFYEAQRSGRLPADQRITWRWDSALGDGGDVGVDLTGGYYDAGDHVKFGLPLAYTGTVLAWGAIAYEAGMRSAGEYDNARAAVRWVAEYLLKAHSAPGELYGQVGDGGLDHAYWGRPEEMTMPRPAAKITTQAPGSDLAGETAAALAAASILFSDDAQFSTACLDAARDLYDLADLHRQIYTVSIPGASGYYDSFSGYGDELAWSAIWLYKATGDEAYHAAAVRHWDEFGLGDGAVQFSWDDKTPGCYALFAELDGGPAYVSALQGFVDQTINGATYTPGGLVHLDTWGALRHAMNVAFIAHRAADLGINTASYRAWATGQLHYALGDTGHSFVVGFGVNPPERPHHRASSCPQYPASCTDSWAQNQPGPNPHTLYGALVGGPDQSDNYVDDRMDFVHNEVACDYNAAFVGVLAATVQNSS